VHFCNCEHTHTCKLTHTYTHTRTRAWIHIHIHRSYFVFNSSSALALDLRYDMNQIHLSDIYFTWLFVLNSASALAVDQRYDTSHVYPCYRALLKYTHLIYTALSTYSHSVPMQWSLCTTEIKYTSFTGLFSNEYMYLTRPFVMHSASAFAVDLRYDRNHV